MPIETDDDLLARAAAIADHALHVAAGRRRHGAIVFRWLPDGELASAPLQGRGEPVAQAWERVAVAVERDAARGVIFVGDGWTELVSEDGSLAEALIVAALTRSGRERTWAAPVLARGLRSTRLGPAIVADDARPSFLAPVRRAFGVELDPDA